ncbi:hypothetical protein C1T31_00570 [Hanstruepera neustonica]|uniref:Uncharacterized protein n=2 Tax=Hanstruepera neustonica TaxID=1445657 RepID=A0A2K1E311_9FLAO|nr:hypothetical protein C1T31_00570 [Hanstruepera neustonica]
MKPLKSYLMFVLSALVLLTSCRKEELERIESPPENTLVPNSNVANLMKFTALNDGSNDNILDYANCFNIQLPVTVTVNGQELVINNDSDLNIVEIIFEESDTDVDTIFFSYPITITLTDFTEVIINDYSELSNYASNCNGENIIDDDIECLDFIYPIGASVFNTNNELINTVSLQNDYELYEFIENIDSNDIVAIAFPISMVLFDGTQITVNNLMELESTINTFSDSCDEDDDYDYNDDDCNGCTTNQLEDILINCSNWIVDKLERNGDDFDDTYNGYVFNFLSDGTITSVYNSNNYYGTWSTEGSGNEITVIIDIPTLPLCNNNWGLHEIQDSSGETKVDLRVGDDDRLRYESTCN